MTSRKNRFESVPGTPPSCTNRDVNVRHQSPCSPSGVRCKAASTSGSTSPRTLEAAVTPNTTAVTTGNRRNPNRRRTSACATSDLRTRSPPYPPGRSRPVAEV
jgi:hypothetical protein